MHIIFATKHGLPVIDLEIEIALHNYLAGICKSLQCPVIRIGGYTNHVHILCLLYKRIPLTKLMEELKSHSSKWIKSQGGKYHDFYWQDGYGAFSVNHREVDRVKAYIEQQKEHHRKVTFREEYMAFLKEQQVEFNEKFIWS